MRLEPRLIWRTLSLYERVRGDAGLGRRLILRYRNEDELSKLGDAVQL